MMGVSDKLSKAIRESVRANCIVIDLLGDEEIESMARGLISLLEKNPQDARRVDWMKGVMIGTLGDFVRRAVRKSGQRALVINLGKEE